MTIRLADAADAADLAVLLRQNREHLAAFEPVRQESFFAEAGQREALIAALAEYQAGRAVPFVILDDGDIVGRINLNTVVRGAFQSASIGYWVSHHRRGHGLATSAVAAVVEHAFERLGLHRVEAGTLETNAASQRVLRKNGFEPYGLAPQYLRIAGRWQDHVLFQRINPAWTP